MQNPGLFGYSDPDPGPFFFSKVKMTKKKRDKNMSLQITIYKSLKDDSIRMLNKF